MERKIHDKIIPIGERRPFAYQEEPMSHVLVIQAHIPHGRGKEPYENAEADKVNKYELKFERHTANCLLVTLSKFRTDIVEQRMEKGEAVKIEHFQFGISFAELVNKLFAGESVLEYETGESLPDSVKAAMRIAYNKEVRNA